MTTTQAGNSWQRERSFLLSSAGAAGCFRKEVFTLANDPIKRGVSVLLAGAMMAGMLPAAALADAPDTHNYQATVYKNQVPGQDELMGPDEDLNIYVSIDMSGGNEQIYSVHTCSDPHVSDPYITPATQENNGLISYVCSHCNASAEVEIPQLGDDALVPDDSTGLQANGSEWERWLGSDPFPSTVLDGSNIVQIQNRLFNADIEMGVVEPSNVAMLANNADGATVLAAGSEVDDDPNLWPSVATQGVVYNTTQGKEKVHLFVDFEHPDDRGATIKAAHRCEQGASLVNESKQATDTEAGYIKYRCDKCGSTAELTIPKLTLDAFTLTEESKNDIQNGIVYNGDEHTIVYEVAPNFRRFVGANLTNNVRITETGRYSVIITIDNACYDNVELHGTDELTVRPKPVTPPGTDFFQNKIYDGTSLLDGKLFSYQNVKGQQITVPMTVHAVALKGTSPEADESIPLSDPAAAGAYAVTFTIEDKNYCWDVDDDTGNIYSRYTLICYILPKTEAVFVGDKESDIKLLNAESDLYTFNVYPGQASFDSSKAGNTKTTVLISRKDGSWNGISLSVSGLDVEVKSRQVLTIKNNPVINKPVGTPFDELGLPATVTIDAEGDGGYEATVPVTWNSNSYNDQSVTQTLTGTLDLSHHPELNNSGNVVAQAQINLSKGSATAPSFTAFSKVYDGNATPFPLPGTTEGIQSMSVRYTGDDLNNNKYQSNSPPVNAGTYTAIVEFTMVPGFEQLAPARVSYTINQASRTCPAPTMLSCTTTSVTLNTIESAEYSRDGIIWQESPVFEHLDPGTEYTFYQKLLESEDKNYAESKPSSAKFSTEQQQAGSTDLQPQSADYTGSPISYRVAPISGVVKSTVQYYVDDQWTAAAPTNAGIYQVKVTFEMNSGYAPIDPVETTLTINKAKRQAPPVPTASNVGTNSISITTIPGAVYAIDGINDSKYQLSTLFEGLTPNTEYTVKVKYPADENHDESPESSATIRTANQTATADTVQSAVYTYDGTGKRLVANQPTGCTEVVQTFTGINDTVYGPSTEAPTDPGTYKVAVTYKMDVGYDQIQPQYANLTINKAEQAAPLAPVVTSVTDSSITIETTEGVSYSIDGGRSWQTTGVFTGLNRDTVYSIIPKAVETKFYKEHTGSATEQRTEKTTVRFPDIADQTYEFDGTAKTFMLPKSITGISDMQITRYGSLSSAPSAPGDYKVTIEFTPADGYQLPEELPSPTMHIIQNSKPLAPVLKDESTTYNGQMQAYHGADGIPGITSVTITYVGKDYEPSTTPPTNAGEYQVTAEFTAEDGYTVAPGPYTAKLIIKKAPQEAPVASLEKAGATSLTASAIPGAEYSINGGIDWQDSNVFEDLNPCTSYTILVRMKGDDNHEQSASRPVVGSTSKHQVDIPEMKDYATTYTGIGQPYPYTSTLAELDGVKSVSVMYFGTLTNNSPYSSAEAPVNAGTYTVRFYLAPETNYELESDTVEANMTIERAAQTLDADPSIANRTTTTIAVNPVPGAEYSIDSGLNWQSTPKFSGLIPDTDYTVTMRLAETDNHKASNETSTKTRTIADTGLEYEINYKDETIHFNGEVVQAGNDYSMTDKLDDGSSVKPGSTIYVGLIDDGTGKPGAVTIETLPERPAAPNVTVNPYDYTMNTTDAMEYSTDNGGTWNSCTDDMDVENLQGQDILVRIEAIEDSSFHSDPCTVHVPTRGVAPVIAVNNEAETMNSTTAMEYFDGESWSPCLDNMSVSNLVGENIQVRYSCNGTDPASNTSDVIIPTRNILPNFCFDMDAETLEADSALGQVLDGKAWTDVGDGYDVSDKCGQGLTVRAKHDTEHFASLPEMVTAPLREAAPTWSIDKEKIQVTGLTNAEYSINGGGSWTKIEGGALDVSNMAGQTIIVRTAHTETTFASNPVSIEIFSYAKQPDVKLDMDDETINTTTSMDVSSDGKTWAQATEPLDVSNQAGTTIYIRNHGDDDEFPSEPVAIVIPGRRPKPEVEINNHDETINTTTDMEYSTDGGETWTQATEPLKVSDHTGETILIRLPSTEDEFASAETTIIVPARPDGPIVELDTENQTINTTEDMEYSTDGGETWNPATEPLDVSDLDGKNIIVRYPAEDDKPASSEVTVTIPEKKPAPEVTLDPNTGIISPSKDLEYSDDGGETWKPCPDPFDVSDMGGKDIIIREPATGTELPGEETTIHIPEKHPTPSVILDTDKETINTTGNMEYSTDGGKTWKPATEPMDVSGMTGQDIIIRVPGDEDHLGSDHQTIHIPSRPAAPTVGHTDESVRGRNDGSLTNTTVNMEYRLSGGEWTKIDGTSVTGLASGTYEIRYSHTADNMASLVQTVTIVQGRVPSSGGGGGGSSSSSYDYTVRFDSNGGSSVASKTVERNETVREPKEPARKGYVFKGWYTDKALKNEYDFSEPVKKSFTLYAKWEKEAVEQPVKPVPPAQNDKSWMLNKEDHIAYIAGRTADKAAPMANITRGEVAMIIYRLLSDEAKLQFETSVCTFKDVAPDAWNRTAITTLSNAGILAGYDNSKFGPNDHITRAQLATILARFCDAKDSTGGDHFTDIATHWARQNINTAAAAGLVQGYGNGTFRPDNKITRAETVVMINRILGRNASAKSVIPGYKTFSDIKETDWFYWDIIEAANTHRHDAQDGIEKWTKLG